MSVKSIPWVAAVVVLHALLLTMMPNYRRRPFRKEAHMLLLGLLCALFCPSSSFQTAKWRQSAPISSIGAKYPGSPKKRTSASQLDAKTYWESDDMRSFPRFKRRLKEQLNFWSLSSPGRLTLIVTNMVMFFYQTINSVLFLKQRHPHYWSTQAPSIITDVLAGTSISGPLTMDFVLSPLWADRQPHRYLTSGFLHGSLLHLVLNMDAIRRSPEWLETGLGIHLFISTYLLGIVSGGMFFVSASLDHSALCLGSSGGICALYGLQVVALMKMGNNANARSLMFQMAIIFLYGILIPQISNAAHVGGFFGGILMGTVFGPSYSKSYAMRRKNSVEVDPASRDYRLAMGFGKAPSKQGWLPLWALWVGVLAAVLSVPSLRRVPANVFQGLRHPGSLSALAR
jgi:membrane associated rhomboid family serine protease